MKLVEIVTQKDFISLGIIKEKPNSKLFLVQNTISNKYYVMNGSSNNN